MKILVTGGGGVLGKHIIKKHIQYAFLCTNPFIKVKIIIFMSKNGDQFLM